MSGIDELNAALRTAASNNDVLGIEKALAAGAHPDSPDPSNGRACSPLFEAAENGRREAVMALVAGGANVAARDYYRQIPLDSALLYYSGEDHEDYCIWLAELTGGAAAKSECAVGVAAERGFVRLIDVLVSLGCTHDGRGSFHHRGVAAPAWGGSLAGAEKMFELGADLERRDDNGATALYIATNGGHAEIAHWLLRVGANPDVQTNVGATPLQAAAAQDNAGLVTALLAASKDPVAAKDAACAAYQMALELGSVRALVALESAGYGEEMDQDRLNQALAYAAKGGRVALVRELLSRGADPTAKSEGRTLLQHAKGSAEVKQLILAARAGLLIEGALDTPLGQTRQKGSSATFVL